MAPVDPNAGGKPNEESAPQRSRMSFSQRLRTYMFAGILVTAPIFITFYLAWLFITFVDSKINPLIPAKYNPETYLPFAVPGLRLSERVLGQMPVIRNVYSAVKQILETVLAQQSNAFREAVLIEYPRRGIWAIGFLTGSTKGEVQNLTEEECINVFLPTTPNPTSGFLLFVPKKDLIPLSMSVEDAIKMVISGGIVTPPDQRPSSQRAKPLASAQTYEELEVLREKEKNPVLVPKGSRPNERFEETNPDKSDKD
jgi:uncharacterized membrane protein